MLNRRFSWESPPRRLYIGKIDVDIVLCRYEFSTVSIAEEELYDRDKVHRDANLRPIVFISAFIGRRVEQLQELGQGRGLDLDQPEPRRDPGRGRGRQEGEDEDKIEGGHQGQEGETNSKVRPLEINHVMKIFYLSASRVAQRKRTGPITQGSMDRNHPLLIFFSNLFNFMGHEQISIFLSVKVLDNLYLDCTLNLGYGSFSLLHH